MSSPTEYGALEDAAPEYDGAEDSALEYGGRPEYGAPEYGGAAHPDPACEADPAHDELAVTDLVTRARNGQISL
jgi:hypothetical protein